MIPVIDHESCLAAVDADILTGDKASLVRCQEENHVGDIHGISHPAGRLLGSVRSFIDRIGGIDPAGADGIDPYLPGKADRQGVGQGGDTAFGSGLAFTLGLTHPIPGG